jgi:predicted DNA-binding transcriptional regulator YafY
MAKRRSPPPIPAAAVTSERAVRLFRLVTLLGEKPQTRVFLTRRLDVGVRDFYRDLEILRKAGIAIAYERRKYSLASDLEKSRELIPFPISFLTLGEAEQLARGRTRAHRKLKDYIQAMKANSLPRSRKEER